MASEEDPLAMIRARAKAYNDVREEFSAAVDSTADPDWEDVSAQFIVDLNLNAAQSAQDVPILLGLFDSLLTDYHNVAAQRDLTGAGYRMLKAGRDSAAAFYFEQAHALTGQLGEEKKAEAMLNFEENHLRLPD